MISALLTFNHRDSMCEIRGPTFSERTAKVYKFRPALSVQLMVLLINANLLYFKSLLQKAKAV